MGIGAFGGLTLAAALVAGAALADCAPDRAELRGDWGQAAFRVEVADDAGERARGLMFRERMDRLAGMLFIYEKPGRVAFWMRNTLIPLDMVFLGPDGVVRRVHRNAVPLDETPIPGGDGILAVLEVNAGVADAFGIDVGTELRHPGLPQEQAAWPCEGLPKPAGSE